jgi:hypothetical protein
MILDVDEVVHPCVRDVNNALHHLLRPGLICRHEDFRVVCCIKKIYFCSWGGTNSEFRHHKVLIALPKDVWGGVDISPRRQPDRSLSTLNYGLTPDCNLSQSRHGRTPIAFTHTTGKSNTHLSQVSYRNLLRSQYKQGCNQCEHSYTKVYQNRNAHQLHINAPYKHISVSVSTSPVERTN